MQTAISILEIEFNKRKIQNPSYSLRSFARNLGISPGILSQILSGKKSLTPKVLNIISSNLNIDKEIIENLLKQQKEIKKSNHVNYINNESIKMLDMETFSVIANWYHYAILELFNLDYFEINPVWISGKLGISLEQAKDGINNLLKTKLLKLDVNGEFCLSENCSVIQEYTFSSLAMKERQKQILVLSATKLDKVNIVLRDHSSITISVDLELLPEIKERIKNFRRILGNYIAKNSKKSSAIYELQIGFFPTSSLDNVGENEDENN